MRSYQAQQILPTQVVKVTADGYLPQSASLLLSDTATSLHSSAGILFWQRCESQIWLNDSEVREERLCLLVLNTRSDDHIITRHPVDRCGNTVFITSLQGVDDAKDFGCVSAGRGWVGEDCADGFLGVDYEDGTDGESYALRVDVGGILVVKPVFY